jgi:hypothetical protein
MLRLYRLTIFIMILIGWVLICGIVLLMSH